MRHHAEFAGRSLYAFRHKFRAAAVMLVASALVLTVAACGSGAVEGPDDEASSDGGGSANGGGDDTGGNGDDTGGNGDDTGGNGPGGVTIEYPAGGPVDPIFPTDDPAYEWLSEGQCQRLLDAVATWEVPPEEGSLEGSVADFHGEDTIAVYRSAANACLLRWDEAESAFDQIAGELTFNDVVSDEGRCARQAVHEWVAGLLEAHREDPNFSPTFVPASRTSQCPTTDLDNETPDNGDSEASDSGDSEAPDNGDSETPDNGDSEAPDTGDSETPNDGDRQNQPEESE